MKTTGIVLLILLNLTSINVSANDGINTLKKMIIAPSTGPAYKQKIEKDIDRVIQDDDLYKAIEDGYNYEAQEKCEPDVYQVIDYDQSFWPEYEYSYQSIKKVAGARSVAYKVNLVLSFYISYDVYKTKADAQNDNETTMEINNCRVKFSESFYYKHTYYKTPKLIGYE